MDSSRQALQSNGKLFFKFRISFRNIGRKPKNIELRGVDIDLSAMCCISMDSSRQALQTIGKLFFKFRISFRNIGRKPKNIQTNWEAWILI